MKKLRGSGAELGYKARHLKCTEKGYVVAHETVRLMLQLLDPEGVASRRRHRLRRREYRGLGPNFMWHVDSHDKLKLYGVCINGAIDGLFRYILWLDTNTTNSDLKVIGGYFIDAVEMYGGVPTRVRADMGTEKYTFGTCRLCFEVFIRTTIQIPAT